MKGGDVTLAGILFSADEWISYDPSHRAELMAAASTSSDPWVMAPATGALSGPIRMPVSDDGT
jgi:hypothetical protein